MVEQIHNEQELSFYVMLSDGENPGAIEEAVAPLNQAEADDANDLYDADNADDDDDADDGHKVAMDSFLKDENAFSELD